MTACQKKIQQLELSTLVKLPLTLGETTIKIFKVKAIDIIMIYY